MSDSSEYISQLDSERFGFTVAKILGDRAWHDATPEQLIEKLAKQGVALAITRVSLSNATLINSLESIGFQLKDVQARHKHYDPSNYEPSIPSKTDLVESGSVPNSIVEEIDRITKTSFLNYGHYAANPRLNKDKCLEIYRDWARRCCLDPAVADCILLIKRGAQIEGYLAMKKHFHNGRHFGSGVIAATSPEHRRSGVAGSLIKGSLSWGKSQQLDWIECNALVNNYPMTRVLSSAGFKIDETWVTLHHWIE